MGSFRIDIDIENMVTPGERRRIRSVLVDTGAELSCLPSMDLEALGIQRRRQRRFRQADGTVLERWTGGALLYAAGSSTVDEVIFGEPGDLVLLGSRSLEGLNLQIDPVAKRLSDAGPMPLAGVGMQHTQAEIAAQLLEWSRTELALSVDEMAEILGASSRSVSRWLAREVPPTSEYGDRIGKFAELRYLLQSVFQDQKSRIDWMHSPLPMLKGRTPLGALRKSGWDEVLGVLAGLESGAFA